MERWWGPKRFLLGYILFGLGGATLTIAVGLLSTTSLLQPVLGEFWSRPHLGASGAVMGVLVGWGMTFRKQEANFLFLPRMKAWTFVLVVVVIELLTALSLSPVSSTSHFGGMATAFILCGGWWRPSRWGQRPAREDELLKKKASIMEELAQLERQKTSTSAEVQGPRSAPPKKGGSSNGNGGTTWN